MSKRVITTFLICSALISAAAQAEQITTISGTDNKLTVNLHLNNGNLTYEIFYDNELVLEPSALGLSTSIGDFAKDLSFTSASTKKINERYQLKNAKASDIHYQANQLTAAFSNSKQDTLTIEFQVSDHDVAYRYRIDSNQGASRVKVLSEATCFNLPDTATSIITPQALPETGWMQTKPSYEEPYTYLESMQTPSLNGVGYTFPALFKNSNKGWLLISETGVDSNYVGSRLSEGNKQGLYRVEFPQPGENSGIGDTYPSMALPATTPWRTITVGKDLAPIVESTVAYDVVKSLYDAKYDYKMGRATWSWIVWQDDSINYADQLAYIDLASALNFEYVLIDNWWDQRIGRDKIAKLAKYAKSKNVDLILWYNSNGWWNDAPQTPQDVMNNSARRKQEMAWLQSIGIKGLKVDFFGGDKQETIKLYEDILVDANKYDLVITFHGSTLPRGWERMYPNFVTSEAVLASENLVFRQDAMDQHAFNATILPFTRNAVGAMDFAPVFLNKRLSKEQNTGTIRTTTDAFELATAIVYQSPVQHFGITPNNLHDQAKHVLDFLRKVPSDWDETRLISGTPGEHVVIARRKGNTWYLGAVNGESKEKELTIFAPMLSGQQIVLIEDDKTQKSIKRTLLVPQNGQLKLSLDAQGGAVIYNQ